MSTVLVFPIDEDIFEEQSFIKLEGDVIMGFLYREMKALEER